MNPNESDCHGLIPAHNLLHYCITLCAPQSKKICLWMKASHQLCLYFLIRLLGWSLSACDVLMMELVLEEKAHSVEYTQTWRVFNRNCSNVWYWHIFLLICGYPSIHPSLQCHHKYDWGAYYCFFKCLLYQPHFWQHVIHTPSILSITVKS